MSVEPPLDDGENGRVECEKNWPGTTCGPEKSGVSAPTTSDVGYGVSFSVEYLLESESLGHRNLNCGTQKCAGTPSRLTPLDSRHQAIHNVVASDGILLGTLVPVEKPEEENVDVGNMIVESLVLCRSGRAPGILEEESAGCPCKYKDCSRFPGTGRGNPCYRTEKTRTEYGVDQNLTSSLTLRGVQLGRAGVWSRGCVLKSTGRDGRGMFRSEGQVERERSGTQHAPPHYNLIRLPAKHELCVSVSSC
jgi:hypothetical protein